MMTSLKRGAPRISVQQQIFNSEGTKTQLQQQAQKHGGGLESSAVCVRRREEPQNNRMSWTSICSNSSTACHWTQAKSPGLYVGLKRSSNTEKVPRLKDKHFVRSVFCVSNLASTSTGSRSHDVVEESLYRRFVDHATQQCGDRMLLKPYPVKSEFRELVGKDGKALTRSSAFQSEKIRHFRAADINAGTSIQVLNLVAFPSTAHELPIFCADLVSFAKKSVIVIDLSTTLYRSLDLPTEYKEKYFSPLYPFWKKYSELLPWGGEVTSEALDFFSPFVIWSRPLKDQKTDDVVFDAFKDYLNVWLDMVDKAEASNDVHEISKNQAAQHRYMSWRSAKDPGRPLLTRLYGEMKCEEYMKEFLFAELDNMGTMTFLDYYPQFKDPNGSILKKSKVSGKAYSTRPWDENGNLILSDST